MIGPGLNMIEHRDISMEFISVSEDAKDNLSEFNFLVSFPRSKQIETKGLGVTLDSSDGNSKFFLTMLM